MESWLLVVFIYAGMLAKGDSVALQAVTAFPTKAQCESAGKELAPLVAVTTKELRFVCIKQGAAK